MVSTSQLSRMIEQLSYGRVKKLRERRQWTLTEAESTQFWFIGASNLTGKCKVEPKILLYMYLIVSISRCKSRDTREYSINSPSGARLSANAADDHVINALKYEGFLYTVSFISGWNCFYAERYVFSCFVQLREFNHLESNLLALLSLGD